MLDRCSLTLLTRFVAALVTKMSFLLPKAWNWQKTTALSCVLSDFFKSSAYLDMPNLFGKHCTQSDQTSVMTANDSTCDHETSSNGVPGQDEQQTNAGTTLRSAGRSNGTKQQGVSCRFPALHVDRAQPEPFFPWSQISLSLMASARTWQVSLRPARSQLNNQELLESHSAKAHEIRNGAFCSRLWEWRLLGVALHKQWAVHLLRQATAEAQTIWS